MQTQDILSKVRKLRTMYLTGLLGGEIMPEDANPLLPSDSAANYLYFTLPMALNYQRNSYTLWKSALKAYEDPETHGIFDPHFIVKHNDNRIRELLLKHKVALQPNKHCDTWKRLCQTIYKDFDGDIRNLFILCKWDVPTILEYIQRNHKRDFPYLCGPKICNYCYM